MRARALVIAATLSLALGGRRDVAPAPAIAPPLLAHPRAVLLHGGSLAQPVVLHGPAVVTRMMAALVHPRAGVPAPPLPAAARHSVELALFWAPVSPLFPAPGDSAALSALGPADVERNGGAQRGRFYPAFGDAPALVVLEPAAGFRAARHEVSADGLALLAARGVPVRLSARDAR